MSLIEMEENVIFSKLGFLCLDEICRSCLTNKLELKSLFSPDSSSIFDVKVFLNHCIGLQIEQDDGMPTMICLDCKASLTAAYNFQKQCEKADSILRKFIFGSFNKLKSTIYNSETKEEIVQSITVQLNGDICGKEPPTGRNGKNKFKNIEPRKNCKNKPIRRKNKSIARNSGYVSDNSLGDVDDNISLYNLSNINKKEADVVIKEEDIIFVAKDEIFLHNTKHSANQINNTLSEDRSLNDKYGKKTYECSDCDQSFTSIRGLSLHGRVHSGPGGLICDACGRSFANARSLRDHRLSHIGDKPYQCGYCDRKFAQKKPLQYHEKTHTGERPHVCDVCGKSYIQPNNLVIHRRLHTGEKPFICKECGKAFTNGASLTLHMPVHTGVKDFVCTICGKRMARSGELTIHMRTHSGEKPYVCRTCSKAFIKKSSLQAHMYSHTGEKKFVCPICGHRVAHAGKLTVHIRTHSSAKPFACPICDRRFANQGYLKQHSKIHSGERAKPFVCTQCGRGFVKNRNLTEHMRTHTGERPFICLVCKHGFAQRSTLNFHMKSAHGEPKGDLTSCERLSSPDQSPPGNVSKFDSGQHNKVSSGDVLVETKDSDDLENELTSDSTDKAMKKNESPPSVIHPNPQDLATFNKTASNVFIPSCELKTGLDHRGAYDPRLQFLQYPLQ